MKLAIFDFDGTLLQKDTVPCLAREWIRQGRSKSKLLWVFATILPIVFLYKVNSISRETFKEKAVKRFNGLYRHLTRQDIEEFFTKAYPMLKRAFSPAVLREIDSAQQQGFQCVIVSGAYQELLQIVAQDLGIGTALGAKLPFNDHLFAHRMDMPFVDGKTKRRLLLEAFKNEAVEWELSRAYGDSYTDKYIIETVGVKVAVNPDEKLKSYAEDNNWRILRD